MEYVRNHARATLDRFYRHIQAEIDHMQFASNEEFVARFIQVAKSTSLELLHVPTMDSWDNRIQALELRMDQLEQEWLEHLSKHP